MRIILILSIIFLTGCTTMGTKVDTQKVQDIKKGVTTEKEVITLIGTPDRKTITDSGNIIMEYVYTESKAKLRSFIPYVGLISSGADINQQTLSILIKNGVVDNFTFNESESEVKYGIIK